MAEEKSKASLVQVGEHKLDDMVSFTANYPKDYKGAKHMVEGKTYKVHKLHAERLELRGLGKTTKI